MDPLGLINNYLKTNHKMRALKGRFIKMYQDPVKYVLYIRLYESPLQGSKSFFMPKPRAKALG